MTLKTLLGAAIAGASLAAGSLVVGSQKRADPETNYNRVADAAVVLQKWYDWNTGLWRESNWWNSANILQALGNLDYGGDRHPYDVRQIYENTFDRAQRSFALSVKKTLLANGLMAETHSFVAPTADERPKIEERGFDRFLNDYYDDEGWWALALLRAHDLGFGPQYIEMANGIFEDMKGGASHCGGIYWDKRRTYTNAIANELYLAVAASLANRMPASLKSYYLDTALRQWTWFRNSGMINSENLVNDGLTENCVNNGYSPWTYNQGVILGALIELTKATGDNSYVNQAHTIATAAIRGLNYNGVLQERDCGQDCGGDGNQFKGIFMRNLQYLHQFSPRDEYRDFIMFNADRIYDHARNGEGEIGAWWWEYVRPSALLAGSHSSGLDALVAAFAIGQ
ncbi:hypothetical protein DL769_008070 [Monosporascus sp. CRB-8-3]|nr:hypothetical protein DL769_008070 [Monosporascus sp. CRB-8-3]